MGALLPIVAAADQAAADPDQGDNVEPAQTPFGIALAHFIKARRHFDALAEQLETGDPLQFEREEDAYMAAVRAADEAPVSSWHEFADAFELACDGGYSVPREEQIFKLLQDARNLTGGPSEQIRSITLHQDRPFAIPIEPDLCRPGELR